MYCQTQVVEGGLRCTVCERPYPGKQQPFRSVCRPKPSTSLLSQAKASRKLPCVHLGESIGFRDCPTCRGNVRLKLYDCPLHGQVTARDCAKCVDYEAFGPERVVRVELPNHSFNGAIFEDRGRLRLCWRQEWSGSTLWLADIDNDYLPGPAVKLKLPHPRCRAGREDPRIWTSCDRLHVSFSGVEIKRGQTVVNMMVARLRQEGNAVDQVWEAHCENRQGWEKNWGWFARGRELYAVYTISPHVVLRHCEGVLFGHMEPAYRQEWAPKWSGGMMRGGASPVLHNGQWYSFFHGVLEGGGQRVYSLGCYTFSAEPPFAPLRYTPDPIWWPPEAEPGQPNPSVRVVFPGGAVFRNGRWLLAAGINDQYVAVAEFDAVKLDRAMVKA